MHPPKDIFYRIPLRTRFKLMKLFERDSESNCTEPIARPAQLERLPPMPSLADLGCHRVMPDARLDFVVVRNPGKLTIPVRCYIIITDREDELRHKVLKRPYHNKRSVFTPSSRICN